MEYTTKRGLRKPDLTDYYNVEDMNINMEKVDEYPKIIENENGRCVQYIDGTQICTRTIINFDRTLAGYQNFFFAKSFIGMPSVSASPTIGNYAPYVKSCSTTVVACDVTYSKWIIQVIDFTTSGYNLPLYAQAIGRWK